MGLSWDFRGTLVGVFLGCFFWGGVKKGVKMFFSTKIVFIFVLKKLKNNKILKL